MRCTHTDPNPICTHCRLIATDERYQRKWQVPEEDVVRWQEAISNQAIHISTAKLTSVCDYRGNSVPARKLFALNLNPAKHWYECEHSEQPLGTIVCPCRGCGPRCTGYTVDDVPQHHTLIVPTNSTRRAATRPATRRPRTNSTTPYSPLVTVPTPPPLNLHPTSSRAVVTVAAGEQGQTLLSISRSGMEAYARRCGADFVILTWPGNPEWPISSKFALYRVLDYYERVIFLDADTLTPHDAPNLFDLVAPDEFGAYNDLPGILKGGSFLIDQYQEVRESQQLPRKEVQYYINTGVMVFSKTHQQALLPPLYPIAPLHCSEQHVWIARLHDLGVKVKKLDAIHNYQWWDQEKFAKPIPPGARLHFSGMEIEYDVTTERPKLMRKWVTKLRPKLPPVYSIVCDELPVRRDLLLAHLAEHSITPTLWRAPHGKSWGLHTLYTWERTGRSISQESVGTLLGHYYLWHHLQLSGVEEALIVEDDVILPDNFAERLAEFTATLPTDWNFAGLGHAHGSLNDDVNWGNMILGSHAYLVRKSALPVLLACMRQCRAATDVQLYENIFHRGLLTRYTTNPPLVTQRTSQRLWASTHSYLKRRAVPLLAPSCWAEIFEPWRNKRIGYVRLPGNVGDKLIELAAMQLFSIYGVEVEIVDPAVGPSSTINEIAIAGGGNMGTLYPQCRAVREQALTWGLPTTILPQSFSDVEDLPYTRVFVREPASLTYCKRAILSHDLALGFDSAGIALPEPPPLAHGTWLRTGPEAVTIHRNPAHDPTLRVNTPAEYLRLAAHHSHVITDRLHFAIAALICSRRVTLCPNTYHKNRSMWEHDLRNLGCEWADSPAEATSPAEAITDD